MLLGCIWHEAQNFTRFAFLFTLTPILESNKCVKTKKRKKGMDTMFSLTGKTTLSSQCKDKC